MAIEAEEEAGLDEESLQEIRKGRTLLWIALVAGLVAIPALITNKPVLSLVAWIASFLGGLGGISNVARGAATSPILKYLAMVLVFVPPVNLLAIGGFLLVAQGAIKRAAEESAARARREITERARQRSAANAAPAAKPSQSPQPPLSPQRQAEHRVINNAVKAGVSPENKPADLRRAIACVKQAGLFGTGDGNVLQVGVPGGEADVSGPAQPIARACLGAFAVFYLVDRGDFYSYVNVGELEAAGLARDQLHSIGLKNLAAMVDGKPGLSLRQANECYMLIMGGQFEASLVLLDGLWEGPLAEYIPNGAVVAIPARDVCAFCDAKSAEGVAGLRRLSERITSGGDHLISSKLHLRKGGKWQPYDLEKADLPPLEFR